MKKLKTAHSVEAKPPMVLVKKLLHALKKSLWEVPKRLFQRNKMLLTFSQMIIIYLIQFQRNVYLNSTQTLRPSCKYMTI